MGPRRLRRSKERRRRRRPARPNSPALRKFTGGQTAGANRSNEKTIRQTVNWLSSTDFASPA